MVWGQARTVKLIEMYAQHRNLWDSKHEHFRCKVRKLDSIRHIARMFNSDPYEINKKLKTLLTQYRREKKIIDGGDPEKTKIPWFAYKHFGFLTDENWTPSTSHISSDDEKKYENNYEEELEKWYDIEINENTQQSELERDVSSNETPTTNFVPMRTGTCNKDEIGVYTEVIAHTLRKINSKNPKRYCMLKHQIDNLLYEAEMELYENPNTQPQSVEILQVQLKT